MSRTTHSTSRAALLRLGFQDPGTARQQLALLGTESEVLLAILGRTADPDQALTGLARLAEVAPDADALRSAVVEDEGTAMRLLTVLGASQALTDHLVRHPAHWRELTDPSLGSTRPAGYAVRAALLGSVGADPAEPRPVATVEAAADV
ncbi:MAG TPA: bifunctional glutamine-synthetase adenylyltransferase/deadenyltransferase, partial [Nocardioides sp.]|nr:bifunctional glutamine-synthetase adenylyltransferase/deadenyltransferase [Nocardioides sp.]